MDSATATPNGDRPRPVPLDRVNEGGLEVVLDAYDRHATALYSYVASLTRLPDAAEEVVQEAFVRFVGAVRSGRGPDEPRAWLYAVCTNLVASRGRRQSIAGRWLHILRPGSDELQDEPADLVVLRRERNAEIRKALAELPREHRAALLLAAEGFNGREIATILGRSEGATRNILWRSRLAVRDRLEAGGSR
jgi:RNA polymerase sigma-70 factor (ECF subfamily)